MRYLFSIISTSLCLSLFCQTGISQDLNSIKKELEGRFVLLKIDMPASNHGIDLNANSEVPLNQKVYNERITEYGISISTGDTTAITKIDHNKNSIIIYLGAGGYDHNEHLSTTKPKQIVKVSEKEKSLKKLIAEETDQNKLSKLHRDLNKLKRARKIKQGKIDSKAAESKILEAEKQYIETIKSGSRIYINFPNKVEQSNIDLNTINKILSNYLVYVEGNTAKSSELIIKSNSKNK